MSMSRLTCLSVAVGLSLVSIGCVPYQKYAATLDSLEIAKRANASLITKYNQLMMKYMAKDAGGEMDPTQRAELMAEIEQLKNQLDRNRPAIPSREAPPGTKIEAGGIALGEALLFSPGSAELKPAAAPILDQIVDLLQSNYNSERFIIEGHTDNQPLQSTAKIWKYNMTLAYNRALAVFKYFLDHGIGEDRMVVHSFSFNRPVDPSLANTTEGRRENRRVVVRRSGENVGLRTASSF